MIINFPFEENLDEAITPVPNGSPVFKSVSVWVAKDL